MNREKPKQSPSMSAPTWSFAAGSFAITQLKCHGESAAAGFDTLQICAVAASESPSGGAKTKPAWAWSAPQVLSTHSEFPPAVMSTGLVALPSKAIASWAVSSIRPIRRKSPQFLES